MQYGRHMRRFEILNSQIFAIRNKYLKGSDLERSNVEHVNANKKKKNPDEEDLEQQIEKRKKYSRRRTYNDDANADFINERNSKVNKKLRRCYSEHAAEIKRNMERATVI
uniref:Pre-mRNA-splicing factor SYF2 n=1 Tax=Glossina austeni TaxID=7395 RepID=A0A1A9UWP8_GLOAU